MTDLSQVKRAILIESREDWVGLWEVASLLREELAVTSLPARRRLGVKLLDELLGLGLLEAGEVDWEHGTFVPWRLPREEAVNRIDLEWAALGRDPSIFEIAYFDATPEGQQWADELLAGTRSLSPDPLPNEEQRQSSR